MKISKDLYEYLAGFTDDKTIVKMLSVNKKFNNSVFFHRIFNKKYPFLTEFKEDNETWKDFYLSMVKYISKLENYDIPYIPTEGYDPKYFYYNHKEDIYDDAMEWATEGGHIEIVKLMIEKGADGFNEAMISAAYKGHMEIVKLMIEKGDDDFLRANDLFGTNDFLRAMKNAAWGGHMEIVKLMIEKNTKQEARREASSFSWVMSAATEGGHIEIVKLMIEKGADNFNLGMIGAIKGGNIDIINLMFEKGADDFYNFIRYAASVKNIELIKLLIKKIEE